MGAAPGAAGAATRGATQSSQDRAGGGSPGTPDGKVGSAAQASHVADPNPGTASCGDPSSASSGGTFGAAPSSTGSAASGRTPCGGIGLGDVTAASGGVRGAAKVGGADHGSQTAWASDSASDSGAPSGSSATSWPVAPGRDRPPVRGAFSDTTGSAACAGTVHAASPGTARAGPDQDTGAGGGVGRRNRIVSARGGGGGDIALSAESKCASIESASARPSAALDPAPDSARPPAALAPAPPGPAPPPPSARGAAPPPVSGPAAPPPPPRGRAPASDPAGASPPYNCPHQSSS